MAFSVTILGSSSALPSHDRYPTAHLVNHDERFFLIDCGEGTQMQLRRFKQPMSRINHIFISHLHGDHVFGLFGLISSFSLQGRTSDLHLYCPPLLEKIITTHLNFFDQDMQYDIIYHPYQAKKSEIIYEDKKLTVETLPLKHRIPCCGFIFREKQKEPNVRKEAISLYHLSIQEIVSLKKGASHIVREEHKIPAAELIIAPPPPLSYAFCTDTRYFNTLIRKLQGVNLLYYESTFLHKDRKLARETYHSTAVQAATIAREAGVGKLILGHFSSRYKNMDLFLQEAREIFPESYLAEDGRIFTAEK